MSYATLSFTEHGEADRQRDLLSFISLGNLDKRRGSNKS